MHTLIGRELCHISREVIIAGMINFKIAASRFVHVTQGVINEIKENIVLKGTNDTSKFGVTLFKRKI